jgi:hypothetical protein
MREFLSFLQESNFPKFFNEIILIILKNICFGEQDAEKNIWIQERESNKRLKKTTK